MHSALEECIQHTRTLTVDLNFCSDESKAQSQSLLGENQRKAQRQCGSNRLSVCNKLKGNVSQKESKKKGKRKEGKKSQPMCKDSRRPCTKDMSSEKQEIHQNSPLSINHAELKVEFDLNDCKTESQDVNLVDDQIQKKPSFNPKEQSNCTTKGKPQVILEAKTDLQTERMTNEEAKVDDKIDDIPVIQLKMKNLDNEIEQDFSEETDWFFETSETVVSGNEMHKDELHSGIKTECRDKLDIENLKQKWDTDLLDDIKDLKEGIESDLKIVSERRKRLNEKLAKYIKVGSNADNDDEFNDCFEGLEKVYAGEKDISKQLNDIHKSSKSPESAHTVSNFQNEIQITSQKNYAAPKKTFGCKNIDAVEPEIDHHNVKSTEDTEHSPPSQLFTNKTTDNEEFSFSKGNPELNSERLNVNNCVISKGIDSCAVESQVQEIKKICGKSKANVTKKQADFSCKSSLTNETSRPAENAASHEISSDGKEQTLSGKTSLHKIDSLLMGLGVADKKVGTQLKIIKTSRHLNVTDSIKEDNDISLTLKVNVGDSIAHPEPVIDFHVKKEGLEGEREEVKGRDVDEGQSSEKVGHEESQGGQWLVELIRGLYPEVDLGVAEIVQQVINKQLGSGINHSHYQR